MGVRELLFSVFRFGGGLFDFVVPEGGVFVFLEGVATHGELVADKPVEIRG